jgi:hypothetical protein
VYGNRRKLPLRVQRSLARRGLTDLTFSLRSPLFTRRRTGHNRGVMKITAAVAILVSALSTVLPAQESKPVPKDSVRVSIPGCTKGQVFTARPSATHEAGTVSIRDGMHMRMNGPKKLISEIKVHEGSMIELTGLMKKGQYDEGVAIGGGVRVSPGPTGPGAGGFGVSPTAGQIQIDVEGWRPLEGSCPSH